METAESNKKGWIWLNSKYAKKFWILFGFTSQSGFLNNTFPSLDDSLNYM